MCSGTDNRILLLDLPQTMKGIAVERMKAAVREGAAHLAVHRLHLRGTMEDLMVLQDLLGHQVQKSLQDLQVRLVHQTHHRVQREVKMSYNITPVH